MRSCTRCGIKLSHNYLVLAFMTRKEKRERVLVCSKCNEILAKQPAPKEKQQPAPKEKQPAPKEKQPLPKEKQYTPKENQPVAKPAQAAVVPKDKEVKGEAAA